MLNAAEQIFRSRRLHGNLVVRCSRVSATALQHLGRCRYPAGRRLEQTEMRPAAVDAGDDGSSELPARAIAGFRPYRSRRSGTSVAVRPGDKNAGTGAARWAANRRHHRRLGSGLPGHWCCAAFTSTAGPGKPAASGHQRCAGSLGSASAGRVPWKPPFTGAVAFLNSEDGRRRAPVRCEPGQLAPVKSAQSSPVLPGR